MIFGGLFDFDEKEKEIKLLEEKTKKDDFWNDVNLANKDILKLNNLKKEINNISLLKEKINNNLEMLLLLKEENDEDLKKIVETDIEDIKNRLEELKLELYLNHEYDHKNCILEIHAGAGGTESCDWALMLFRMYTRYCEKKGYKITILDYQDGDEAGIKKCALRIEGKDAYGYLKCEKGVHRLVRLSPFDANHKRHTSFASVDVTPEFDEKIDIDIKDEDLKIDVYHSSGAGGQSVNTTDSAVRITHLPSKIVVTCQNERSQLKNKEKALEILKNKLKMIEIEKQEQKINNLKQDNKNIEFGSQIRSYVMHPYSMVKDHRTSCETSNVSKVLDGDLDMFIEEYLRS